MLKFFIYWLAITIILGSVFSIAAWVICWVDNVIIPFKWVLHGWLILIGAVSLTVIILTVMGIELRQVKIS